MTGTRWVLREVGGKGFGNNLAYSITGETAARQLVVAELQNKALMMHQGKPCRSMRSDATAEI